MKRTRHDGPGNHRASTPAAQRDLHARTGSGTRSAQIIDASPRQHHQRAQLKRLLGAAQHQMPAQREPNDDLESAQMKARTPAQRGDAGASGGSSGLPPSLQAGVEALSGMDLASTRVHYNSPQPDRLGAAAYTQGKDIHVARGQEAHLPHEAWHVVQQRQGRVRATTNIGGTPVNDSPSLEAEADRMGAAAQRHGRE